MIRAGHPVLVVPNAKDAYTRMGLTVGVHVPTISGAGSIGRAERIKLDDRDPLRDSDFPI